MDPRKSEIGTSLKLVIVRVIILFESDWEILRVFSYRIGLITLRFLRLISVRSSALHTNALFSSQETHIRFFGE